MVARRESKGFTVVEVLVSSTILAALVVLVASALSTSAEVTRFDLARNEAMGAARRITLQIARELSTSGGHEGGADHCTPGRAAGATNAGQLTFSMRTQLTGTDANDWSTPITYQLVPNGDTPGDGDDDDRDGVFDEQRLDRSQTGFPTVTLDESVTLFRIDRDAGSDMITLTIEVSRPYKTAGVSQSSLDWVRARVTTNIYLRNRV